MNYNIVFKLLGVILGSLCIAFLISMGVACIYWEDPREIAALHGWMLSILTTFALMIICFFFGRKKANNLLRKEALTLIGVGWVLASLVGALPYLLILPNCSISNAIFESTSGLTTTGASVFADIEAFPRSLLFWRCMSQWIGGLGVVVFFVAILSFLGAGAKILYSNEASAQANDIDASRVQKGVLHIMALYLTFSGLALLAYLICGMEWYDAICYMFTVFATGGFSTYNAGIGAFSDPTIEWVTIVIMIIGGTNFFVLFHLVRRHWKEVLQNEEVPTFYILLVTFSALISFLLIIGPNETRSSLEIIRESTFQVVSIMTTAGFSTVNYQQWQGAGHVFLILLMVIGGCSGSTSGGMKVTRLIVATKISLLNIEKSFRPRLVRPIMLNGRNLERSAQEGIMNYFVLVGILSLVSLPILAFLEYNVSFEGNFSAFFACLFNIGPGFSEVGPASTYNFYHGYTKIFLSLIMIMGRVELYAILALFAPSLWKKF